MLTVAETRLWEPGMFLSLLTILMMQSRQTFLGGSPQGPASQWVNTRSNTQHRIRLAMKQFRAVLRFLYAVRLISFVTIVSLSSA